MKHFDLLTLGNYSKDEILELVDLAEKIKKNPEKYENALRRKTLLMIFAKPSLRTHLSFDVGMYQMGGHAIYYDLGHSTLGEKESIKDFAKVVSRYVNIIMARLYSQEELEELAKYADVPVINGLTNDYHPCQILGDLLTIKEKFGKLEDLKIVYVGDSNNNVTHSLIQACSKLGINIIISSPKNKNFMPDKNEIGSAKFDFEENPEG